MAGNIFVSDVDNVALNSEAFGLFADLIFAGFGDADRAVRDKVFWARDHGSMMAIGAEDLDSVEFLVFCSAVAAGHREAQRRSDFVHFERSWQKLIALIDADVRQQS